MEHFKIVYENLVSDDLIVDYVAADTIDDAFNIGYERSCTYSYVSEGNIDIYIMINGQWIDIFDITMKKELRLERIKLNRLFRAYDFLNPFFVDNEDVEKAYNTYYEYLKHLANKYGKTIKQIAGCINI